MSDEEPQQKKAKVETTKYAQVTWTNRGIMAMVPEDVRETARVRKMSGDSLYTLLDNADDPRCVWWDLAPRSVKDKPKLPTLEDITSFEFDDEPEVPAPVPTQPSTPPPAPPADDKEDEEQKEGSTVDQVEA